MKDKWEIKKLGEICDFENGDRGPNYPSKSFRTLQGIAFINAGHLVNNRIDLKKMDYISRERFDLLGSGKVQKGDILFCLRGSLGKFGMVRNLSEGAIASSLVIVRNRSVILKEYLLYYFCSPLCKKMISTHSGGTAQPNLSVKSLKEFVVPIPPLPEQQRIVTLLDQVFEAIDKARENTKTNIENILGYFESILNNEIIKTNNNWEINKIIEITGKIGSGATPRGGKKNYKKTGIPLIRSMNVYDEGFRYDGLAYLDNDQAQGLVNVKVVKDDILLNITGASILRCCIVPEDVLPARVNQHVSIIRPIQSSIDAKFLHYSLISKVNKDKLMKIGTSGGSTREALTKSNIEEFEVSYPKSLTEQKKIVARLKKTEILIRRFIELLIQKEEFLNEMRNSIINKAFSGEL